MKDLKDRFQEIVVEYGAIAMVVHFTLFGLVLGGSWIALRMGYTPSGAAGSAGTLGAAYLMAQVTKPFRLVAVVALTPLLAPWIRRRRVAAEVAEPVPRDTPTGEGQEA